MADECLGGGGRWCGGGEGSGGVWGGGVQRIRGGCRGKTELCECTVIKNMYYQRIQQKDILWNQD
jgi:hypothetical protein